MSFARRARWVACGTSVALAWVRPAGPKPAEDIPVSPRAPDMRPQFEVGSDGRRPPDKRSSEESGRSLLGSRTGPAVHAGHGLRAHRRPALRAPRPVGGPGRGAWGRREG